jgi:hypothetical protein
MTSIVPLLILMLLIPFAFYLLSLGYKMSEEELLAQRKMQIASAVFLVVSFLILLIINISPIGSAEKTLLMPILTIPPVIVLMYYRHRVCPRKPSDPSAVTLIIVFGILFSSLVYVSVSGYRMQIDMNRKARDLVEQSRLPPLAPPPAADFSLPLQPSVLEQINK